MQVVFNNKVASQSNLIELKIVPYIYKYKVVIYTNANKHQTYTLAYSNENLRKN